MDAKDFYDSGIYIAIVAAAFVLVMLLIVLIGKFMGGSKKSGRKKKAATTVKGEVLSEQESKLSAFDSELVKTSTAASVTPVSDKPVQTSALASVSTVSSEGNNNTAADMSGNDRGKSMSLGDDVTKSEIETLPVLDTKDLKPLENTETGQLDIKLEEDDEENDHEDDDKDGDGMDFFNVDHVEEDTTIAELAADLTDVDMDTLGELTKEISQIISDGK